MLLCLALNQQHFSCSPNATFFFCVHLQPRSTSSAERGHASRFTARQPLCCFALPLTNNIFRVHLTQRFFFVSICSPDRPAQLKEDTPAGSLLANLYVALPCP